MTGFLTGIINGSLAPARRYAEKHVVAAIGMSLLGTVIAVAPGATYPEAIAQAQLSPPADSPTGQSATEQPAEGLSVPAPFMQKLETMFSPEIRRTLNVCQQGQGGVDLTSNLEGLVVCGDGSSVAGVDYVSYLSTLSDMMAASTLLGIRVAFLSNQQLQPEMVSTMLSSPASAAPLRNALSNLLGQMGILSPQSPASPELLADEVMKRLLPTAQKTNNLTTLLGTPEQYEQVVSQFCQAPGTSLEQIQQSAGMDSPQIYAVCLQEAGLADELQRTLQAP
ncbi:MAG TPA: hypothetical protein V6C84_04280 [Coleofasciculaceae cyanobacterium]|jgi:hypothetical protein